MPLGRVLARGRGDHPPPLLHPGLERGELLGLDRAIGIAAGELVRQPHPQRPRIAKPLKPVAQPLAIALGQPVPRAKAAPAAIRAGVFDRLRLGAGPPGPLSRGRIPAARIPAPARLLLQWVRLLVRIGG